jgi:hypothetical protein
MSVFSGLPPAKHLKDVSGSKKSRDLEVHQGPDPSNVWKALIDQYRQKSLTATSKAQAATRVGLNNDFVRMKQQRSGQLKRGVSQFVLVTYCC